MPYLSVRPFRLLVATALMVVLTASSAVPVAAAADSIYPKAERYARSLLNCSRTGGWVQDDGTCIDEGTGKHSVYRKPLPYMARLADDIARPQAQRVAAAGYLDHNLGGSIISRFRKAGITCCAMGESLGHWVKSAKLAALQVHLMVQAEKPYNGVHWRNLKDKRFRHIGIGVWNNADDYYVAFAFWDGKN
jgi:hypothetical protein